MVEKGLDLTVGDNQRTVLELFHRVDAELSPLQRATMVELLTTNQSNASTENDRFNLNGMRRIVNHCRDTMEKKLPDVLDLLMDAQATLREPTMPTGKEFVPFVIETGGRLAKTTSEWLDGVWKDVADEDERISCGVLSVSRQPACRANESGR